MDDPWDVKSVRQAGQYVSCMKLNGTPLLPPVLSKECRAEMQYYKILAKEVEKRISLLKPLVNDSDSDEDKTDAPALPENEHTFHINNKDTISTVKDPTFIMVSDGKVTNNNIENYMNTTKFVIDVSLNINQNGQNVSQQSEIAKPQIEIPEKDCNCSQKDHPMLNQDVTFLKNNEKETESLLNFNITTDVYEKTPFSDINVHDGPSSLSSRSFTGSLMDIHTDAMRDSQNLPQLIRQRSYTVLKPSPQLIAHLEVQSQATGIEMQSISMTESTSNINLSLSPNKKRRSWDLETAKFKWSSMALDLKKNTVPIKDTKFIKQNAKNPMEVQNGRPKSVLNDKGRHGSINSKTNAKSEPIQRTVAKKPTPTQILQNTPSNRTITKETASPNVSTLKNSPVASSPKPQGTLLISESEDPASKVRELYERIQNQQMIQMAKLVEKQKREQLLLQQAFEEQNSLLYKQLKTICPKSPNEIKQAWTESPESDRGGPVSLSQLINNKSPETPNNPLATVLNDTRNYINKCDDALKRSRDLTDSMKKPRTLVPKVQNRTNSPSRSPTMGSRTRTHSPVNRKSSTPRRQIQYDTSHSDRDYEPILTDRTNDTMADLNVTFTTDESAICDPFHTNNTTVVKQFCEESTVLYRPDSMEQCLRDSNDLYRRRSLCNRRAPTAQELSAASRIVAYARGYLVRRLLRTERVQTTVQTIKDALLCALQLHQDREGIRGADVDLHRRLIQQITAACYSLHDTFITSSPSERCALIGADRQRRRSLAARQTPSPASASRQARYADIMSNSHSGAFPARTKRAPLSHLMTRSSHESFSQSGRACCPSPRGRPRPWR